MPRPDLPPYLASIASARDAALALSEIEAAALLRLIAEYAEELSVRVATGLASRGERFALLAAEQILDELVRDLARATRNGVELTARRVAEIHARATAALIESVGATVAVEFGGLALTAAQAVLARPQLAETFRSIRRDSAAAVNRILRRSIARGAGARQIELELRAHMLGAEAFPARALEDRRTAANLVAVRKDARGVAARARLIARHEIMMAQAEAGKQAAESSPVVADLKWFTSQRHPVRDQCDALAEVDWYGLGGGVFRPENLPARPHPRCACGWRHRIASVAEWGRPRPAAGPLLVSVASISGEYGLSPSQQVSLARALAAGQQQRRAA